MTNTELNNATPRALAMPIAKNGDRRQIIDGTSNLTDTQSSIKFGFPFKMSRPLGEEGGLPVTRQDMNEMLNIMSQLHYFLMAGGSVPWSTSERDAINGYANGAIVWHGGIQWKSIVDGNMVEPGTDTSKWVKLIDSGFESLYPVGSIYIGTMDTCPLAEMFGQWEQIEGRYLLASGALAEGGGTEVFNAGSTVTAGLPNITGSLDFERVGANNRSGALSYTNQTGGFQNGTGAAIGGHDHIRFDASENGTTTYGKSNTVRPPAFVVNVWRRTA